jgi:NTP pyrophosphatase (non-canonical NTP hydrolase)
MTDTTKTPNMHTLQLRPSNVVSNVFDELGRAIAKFPTWPTDPLHALAVLGEEFGELTKDVLQMTYEPGKTNAENVRKEAIQTAAMALRFAASLDDYIYKAGEQHRQEQLQAQRAAYYASGGIHPCYD